MADSSEAISGLSFVLRRLTETMVRADADHGKTYDAMAERIRSQASDGLVREALGYVPEEAENLSVCDSFRAGRREKNARPRKKLPPTD